MYIIKLGEGVWLAPWIGDPGRTLKRKNAQTFKMLFSARNALRDAKKYREFKSAIIEKDLTKSGDEV